MQITEIDPDKKYVLVLPQATMSFIHELDESITEFRVNDVPILVIFGVDATVVPVDQVVGYTKFGREDKDD